MYKGRTQQYPVKHALYLLPNAWVATVLGIQVPSVALAFYLSKDTREANMTSRTITMASPETPQFLARQYWTCSKLKLIFCNFPVLQLSCIAYCLCYLYCYVIYTKAVWTKFIFAARRDEKQTCYSRKIVYFNYTWVSVEQYYVWHFSSLYTNVT